MNREQCRYGRETGRRGREHDKLSRQKGKRQTNRSPIKTETGGDSDWVFDGRETQKNSSDTTQKHQNTTWLMINCAADKVVRYVVAFHFCSDSKQSNFTLRAKKRAKPNVVKSSRFDSFDVHKKNGEQ
jgi:hypothetical protein